MDCESNYQINVPSKQTLIFIRNFFINSPASINQFKNKLDPWWITGFTDAEGSFGLYIYKNSKFKTGWHAYLVFSISLHEKDRDILSQIQNFFGFGGIHSHGSNSLKYTVKSLNELQIIIDHFDKYLLITSKLNDYKLFKLAYNLFINKENLSIEGIEKLVAIKSSMNLGLKSQLKLAFPQISKHKDIYRDCFAYSNIKKIPDPYWVSGFTSGEGNFMIDIIKSKSSKLGITAGLRFTITQHFRDKQLMISLIDFFNCGHLNIRNNNCFNLTIRKFTDLDTKIIPFFSKYPIIGDKLLNFQNFIEASKLINNKDHLTIEGLKKINEIKNGMNTKRI
uniref:intronic ORF at intron 1 of nad4 n=1 Tax=Moniliophthora perniciosa TaxID=153609 RepID=UPI0000242358|nr:intronic ORF at intron 1 of nad4 [Moniliophthora perniciosa]AAQ74268.1 intronic ORF at intron 1 of nad4 [Moniliophthora perniciosa]